MSLIITTYVREGIVLSSDSRLSISSKQMNLINVVQSDSVRKTFLTKNNVGISTCGTADISGVPISGYIDSFIRDVVGNQDLNVEDIADLLLNHFLSINPKLNTIFHIAGYDTAKEELKGEETKDPSKSSLADIDNKSLKELDIKTLKELDIKRLKKIPIGPSETKEKKMINNVRIPRVFKIHILSKAKINLLPQPNIQGTTFDGYANTILKIVKPVQVINGKGIAPTLIPTNGIQFSFFTLQDAIDFNRFGTQTTIDTMKFEFVDKSVGGPIDILVIEPDRSQWIQNKKLH